MRIGFFVPRCTPENSHGRYVIELGKRLARDHDVSIYAGAFWPPLHSLVKCHRLPVPNRPAGLRLATLWATSAVAASASRFDIVHVQGADAPIGDVVTAHCCNAAMQRAAGHGISLIRNLNFAIGVAAERHCLTKRSTRSVIAVSEKVKADIQRYYSVDEERIGVIPLGVDAEAFHPRNRLSWRRMTRERLGLAPGDLVVAFVGRDYRLKGLTALLEAVHLAGAGIRVLAVAVRPDADLVAIAPGCITFVGPATDVAPYYAATDCFALPTRYDTFSLATLEAMASGLPAIVSRAAGVSEHLRDGVDALVLEDPSDVNTLAAQLRRLADDEDYRAQLGNAGRETAERFSWERVTDQTAEVYRQTLERPTCS
jgi:UDP-glucose:(heptosyl)LPS alpha-1,3-glucosyltransferase